MNKWTVWVGGSEVNSHLLTYDEANYIKGYWIGQGYDDVVLEKEGKR